MVRVPGRKVLQEVNMKARRAQHHFDALNDEIDKWLQTPEHCTIQEETDFENALQIFRVKIGAGPEVIPMLLGDFICCLRSALDQLAWGLAHLDTKRVFTEREERNIAFPVARIDDTNYRYRLSLFPSTVTTVIDLFQPYHRGNAYRDDPLWQLNELWTMDKHRAIPMNSNSLNLFFPAPAAVWERYIRHFDYHVEVHFPLMFFLTCPVHLKPSATVDVLFGEYMGAFALSLADLRAINNFVRSDVIPKFTGFFT